MAASARQLTSLPAWPGMAVRPRARGITTLSLSLLICRMGIINSDIGLLQGFHYVLACPALDSLGQEALPNDHSHCC